MNANNKVFFSFIGTAHEVELLGQDSFNLLVNVNGIGYSSGSKLCRSVGFPLTQVFLTVKQENIG